MAPHWLSGQAIRESIRASWAEVTSTETAFSLGSSVQVRLTESDPPGGNLLLTERKERGRRSRELAQEGDGLRGQRASDEAKSLSPPPLPGLSQTFLTCAGRHGLHSKDQLRTWHWSMYTTDVSHLLICKHEEVTLKTSRHSRGFPICAARNTRSFPSSLPETSGRADFLFPGRLHTPGR